VSGLIADGITTNHRLLEELLYHTRRVEYEWRTAPRLPTELDDLRAYDVASPVGS
jgi:hypothetical protein